MGQRDKAIKNLISHPEVFADIMNVLVFEGNKVLSGDRLCHVPERKTVITETGKLKELIRDVCMKNLEDGTNYLVLGIENQDEIDEIMPLRIMGYDYASYQSQAEELQKRNRQQGNYPIVRSIIKGQKLTPTVTIVLYYGKEKWDGPTSLKDLLDIPKTYCYKSILPYIQDYNMNLISLYELSREQTNKFISDFRYIAKYISKDYNDNTYINEMKHDEQMIAYPKDTLLAMAAITKDRRYQEIVENQREVETAMCGVCDELERRGRNQGIDQMSLLIRKLVAADRMDDVVRAAEDEDYRNQLFLSYHIDNSIKNP